MLCLCCVRLRAITLNDFENWKWNEWMDCTHIHVIAHDYRIKLEKSRAVKSGRIKIYNEILFFMSILRRNLEEN